MSKIKLSGKERVGQLLTSVQFLPNKFPGRRVSGKGIRKTKKIDIVNDVLEECILAYPVSSFVISLYKQYMQWGNLSKKQLQVLHSIASKIKNIQQNKLATLEAIIKKMPTRNKSE